MIVFADTSALFALLVRDDSMHLRARANFEHLAENKAILLTSSYVLLETLALLQRRVSLEAVWEFNRRIMPIPEIVWTDEMWHAQAMKAWRRRDRSLSLTDCLSFEIMEARGIATAFAFDNHFAEHGFEIAHFKNP